MGVATRWSVARAYGAGATLLAPPTASSRHCGGCGGRIAAKTKGPAMSLTTGVLPTSVVLLAMLTLLCAAQVWTVRGRRRGLIAMLCSVLTVGVFACGQALFGWVPYPFPAVYYVWSVAPVWACCLTVNCFLPTSRQAGAPSTNDNVVRGRRRQ